MKVEGMLSKYKRNEIFFRFWVENCSSFYQFSSLLVLLVHKFTSSAKKKQLFLMAIAAIDRAKCKFEMNCVRAPFFPPYRRLRWTTPIALLQWLTSMVDFVYIFPFLYNLFRLNHFTAAAVPVCQHFVFTWPIFPVCGLVRARKRRPNNRQQPLRVCSLDVRRPPDHHRRTNEQRQ